MKRKPNESKRALVNNLCPELTCDEEEIEQLIRVLDRDGAFDAPGGELSIAFIDKEEIARLHGSFMSDPSPTDVITFAGDPDMDQAGEVCVCPHVALEYAERERLNFSEELSLYVIHGYLHLCGFDDIEEEDRLDMRQAEQTALKVARAADALPTFRWTA